MSGWARTLTAAEMQGRDLLRRRLALVILAALPLAFYLSLGGDNFAPVAGGLGMAWSVAGAGLFSTLAARCIDPRLVQAGYRPAELLLGRLLVLGAVGLTLAAAFGAFILATSAPPNAGALALGVALGAVVGAALGLATAALLPRELEGMLTIIGVVGIEMSLPAGAALGPFLPLYGPRRLLEIATGERAAVGPWLLHGLGAAAVLCAVAVLAWTRQVRPRRG